MRKTLRSRPIESARQPSPEPAAAFLPTETPPIGTGLEAELAELERLSLDDLRLRWRNHWGRLAPAHLSRGLLLRVMAYRLQPEAFGDLDRKTIRTLDRLADDAADKLASGGSSPSNSHDGLESKTSSARAAKNPLVLKPGALLIREWLGRLERVTVVNDGFAWNGATYTSLSAVAFASRARSGTATGSSACSIEIASGGEFGTIMRNGMIEVKGRALWRATRRTIGLSRRPVRRRHRQARQWMATGGSNEADRQEASALCDLHPRLD